MEFSEIEIGMEVTINPSTSCKFTKSTLGWETDMENHIGNTYKIVDFYQNCSDPHVILSCCEQYYWDVRDLIPVPIIKTIRMTGERFLFNEEEIVGS